MTPRKITALILSLFILVGAGSALTACSGDSSDAATARPTAFQTPSGDYCTPWLNNPDEANGSGYRACDMPAPTAPPVRSNYTSDAEFLLAGALLGYVMGHHDFYFNPYNDYYGRYIGPAWSRNPGYGGYNYGGHYTKVTKITVNNYGSVATAANTKYAPLEKQYEKNPKFNGYKTANGKTYTADKLPTKKFNGTNVPKANNGPLGDAPKVKTTPSKPTVKPAPAPKTRTYHSPSRGRR